MAAMLRDESVTHVACAFDHTVESFRNELFDGYKTGDGIEPELRAQFEPLEESLRALDDLVRQSEGIEHGRMLYDVIDFHLPSLAAIESSLEGTGLLVTDVREITFSAPIWASPLAPPPLSTRPTLISWSASCPHPLVTEKTIRTIKTSLFILIVENESPLF